MDLFFLIYKTRKFDWSKITKFCHVFPILWSLLHLLFHTSPIRWISLESLTKLLFFFFFFNSKLFSSPWPTPVLSALWGPSMCLIFVSDTSITDSVHSQFVAVPWTFSAFGCGIPPTQLLSLPSGLGSGPSVISTYWFCPSFCVQFKLCLFHKPLMLSSGSIFPFFESLILGLSFPW